MQDEKASPVTGKTTETNAAEAKLIEQTKQSLDDKQAKPEDAFAALTARFDALKKR